MDIKNFYPYLCTKQNNENVPGNLQYDAYDDVENFRSALNCLILKRYKLQKAAANRSGFLHLKRVISEKAEI